MAANEDGITAPVGRPIVQTPRRLVVMKSSQLDAVQTVVAALRHLGLVLRCGRSCSISARYTSRSAGAGEAL